MYVIYTLILILINIRLRVLEINLWIRVFDVNGFRVTITRQSRDVRFSARMSHCIERIQCGV